MAMDYKQPRPTGSTGATVPVDKYVPTGKWGGTSDPTGTAGDPSLFLSELRALFPWIDQIGIDPKWFQEVAAESGGNADAALVRFRELPQYRQRFPGLWRTDGSLRMNEGQYLATEDAYRQVLRQGGFDMAQFSKPADLLGFFESEQDPDELNERVTTYRNIRDNSQSVKDAFYVYAGIDVSDEDLLDAVFDPQTAERLSAQYITNVTTAAPDYATFISRTAEVAGKRVPSLIAENGDLGAIAVTPETTGKLLDLLYTGGGGSEPLALDDLLAAYEEALLGATAADAGLEIPTKDRIAELRMAGVERNQARQGYLEFARSGGVLSAAAQRGGLGAIDQSRFEQGAFLGVGADQRAIQTALQLEEAAGQQQGSFRFDQDRTGRVYQRGLTA